jgi:hypothetical protein
MNSNDFDKRLCQAALDGLKAYRITEFTTRFLKEHGIPTDKNLELMWGRIEKWMDKNSSRCKALWEYVDDLRLWGRQRIFLYEVVRSYANELSNPEFVKELVGEVYNKALFKWEADKPFLAKVEHKEAEGTGAPLLVFKLIVNQEFNLVIDNQNETFDERSTNFFIINLKKRHAELRIQEPPTGAVRDVREERDLLTTAIGQYLDFTKFKPVDLTPVMDVMLRIPVYTITASRFRFSGPETKPNAPELVVFLNNLFRKSIPADLSACYECNQRVLGKGYINFNISGASDFIGIAGIADSERVTEILEKLMDIKRNPKKYLDRIRKKLKGGIVGKSLENLKDQPGAQAVVLSAGAIVASIIWLIADAVRNYLIESTVEKFLWGIPFVVITITIEVAWTVFYYGWRRIWRGIKILLSLPRREVWQTFKDARKWAKMNKTNKS